MAGMDRKTVVLVNEALIKRGVLTSKHPTDHGYFHELR